VKPVPKKERWSRIYFKAAAASSRYAVEKQAAAAHDFTRAESQTALGSYHDRSTRLKSNTRS
jgi:hypothetical protein